RELARPERSGIASPSSDASRHAVAMPRGQAHRATRQRTWRRNRRGGLRRGRPVGVELAEEQGAALGFVGLADGLGRRAQAVERAQEPAILLVAPADVAGSPPPARPQAVEAPVVADPEVRVALDVVASERAEPGPG